MRLYHDISINIQYLSYQSYNFVLYDTIHIIQYDTVSWYYTIYRIVS